MGLFRELRGLEHTWNVKGKQEFSMTWWEWQKLNRKSMGARQPYLKIFPSGHSRRISFSFCIHRQYDCTKVLLCRNFFYRYGSERTSSGFWKDPEEGKKVADWTWAADCTWPWEEKVWGISKEKEKKRVGTKKKTKHGPNSRVIMMNEYLWGRKPINWRNLG